MTIKEITTEGIYYKTPQDEEEFFTFEDCHKNWLKEYQEKNPSEEQYENMRQMKVVGLRNISWENHEEMWFDFFTSPPTRFTFMSDYEGFSKLHHAIEELGWRTLDCS